jgi:Amt family ammonium transporter
VHLVGGVLGTLLVGLFGTAAAPSGKDGLFYGGGLGLLGTQAVAVVAVLGYSFVVSFLIALAIQKTIGFRLAEEKEVTGVDLVEHAEIAYDLEGKANAPGTGPTPQAVIASAERMTASAVPGGTPGS